MIESYTQAGLKGRLLYLPKADNRQRQILLIYGHHPSLERWQGLADNLNDYGAVTLPDLPGFGGMDSFYKIARKPDIDNYADFLADFLNKRFKGQSITLIGLSFGFVVITRMLQRHPELTERVDMLVSLMGFTDKSDFQYSYPRRRLYVCLASLFALAPISWIIRYVFLNTFALDHVYPHMHSAKRRMVEVPEDKRRAATQFDRQLWQLNDVRTHWQTTSNFLKLKNTGPTINLPVTHVISKLDHYLSNEQVSRHTQALFSGYQSFTVGTKAHVPYVLANKNEMSILLPAGLRRLLNS